MSRDVFAIRACEPNLSGVVTLAVDVFETPDLSIHQYVLGARLAWTKFAHRLRFPVARVFLLICFCILLDRTVPGYVRQPTTA